jgi:hypothetical protein
MRRGPIGSRCRRRPSESNRTFESGLGFRGDSRRASLADANGFILSHLPIGLAARLSLRPQRVAEARLARADRAADGPRRWHDAIMRDTGKSKTCVWRWQERFADEGFEGLLRDKTRFSRIQADPSIAELGPLDRRARHRFDLCNAAGRDHALDGRGHGRGGRRQRQFAPAHLGAPMGCNPIAPER